MKKNKYFYNIEDDLEAYPEAIIYTIIGGRNTGKTFSTLLHSYLKEKRFIFIKRTIEDVKMLLSNKYSDSIKEDVDLSPFKSINREYNTNVGLFDIDKSNGLGAFYRRGEEGEATGNILGYIMALSAVYKFKGFDLSDVEYIIFDEFIPNKWERVKRDEGIQLLELYKTISRAREHKGLEPLKLIMLANSSDIACPILSDFNLIDTLAEMEVNNQEYCYLKDRFILIHKIKDSEEFYETESQSPIYQAMAGTQWVEYALENKFSYNDFSQVSKQKLKGYRVKFYFDYKNKRYYCYYNEDINHYYINRIRANKCNNYYDLSIEIDAGRLFYDEIIDLKNECLEGNCTFSDYSIYDLIMNYKRIMNVK